MTFFLFMAFKSSFVRHDVHAMIGGCSVMMAAMVVGMLFVDRNLIVALLLCCLAWFYTDKNHARTSTNVIFDNLRNVYLGLLDRPPFSHRRRHFLHHEFDHALGEIIKTLPIPDLQGSVDIYPDEQSAVLASNNTWNPRPVFQSYSVYTPELAAMNEKHLRGDSAPGNVLFSVDPIDDRLPSLEDGPSWPAFLDNYTMTRFDRDNDLAYLRRKPHLQSSSGFTVIDTGTHRTNEAVAIPDMDVPIFAQIDLDPTFLGKLRGIMFKYPRLEMELTLRDGKTRSYRVVSNMMRSVFLLSPLVRDTEGFASLMAGDPNYLRRNAVQSIVITPRSGNGTLWKNTYTTRIEAYQRQ
jgi:hypothetical protein